MKENTVHIKWRGDLSWEINKQSRQTFRQIKTIKAAKKIVGGLNKENLISALWQSSKYNVLGEQEVYQLL